ncbi:MAG: LysM peptidoglycan-binding domain-containing protein [Anaerolineales bacterium]|nr:LysM peptidoglycan-binding domain-containing protein [Anaerolineales bacterium]
MIQPQGALAARRNFGAMAGLGVPVTPPDALTRTFQRMYWQVQHTLADQVTPLRLAGHLAVLLIAAVVLILSQIKIPEWELSLEPTPLPAVAAMNSAAVGQSQSAIVESAALRRNVVFTFVDKKLQQEAPRLEISYYTVKSGDTVLGIAEKFGLQPETLMWSNSNIEQNPDRLSIGDMLRILPVDGVILW